jgi:hypothetical protein
VWPLLRAAGKDGLSPGDILEARRCLGRLITTGEINGRFLTSNELRKEPRDVRTGDHWLPWHFNADGTPKVVLCGEVRQQGVLISSHYPASGVPF